MLDEAAIVAGAGPRLRALRRASGLTLAELAAQTGLTTSTLSRLERSQIRPTLEQLLPLSRVHAVSLDELVAAPTHGDPRVHLRALRREGLTYVPLGINRGGLQAFKVIYPAATELPPARLHTHPGRQWVFVLTGRIHLALAGENRDLSPGDAAEFDTGSPHWLGNGQQDTPAEVIAIYGRHGARIHTIET